MYFDWIQNLILQEGKFLFFLLFVNLGIEALMWRMEYHRFNKRYFEKLIGAFFFLFGFFLVLTGISYLLKPVIWEALKIVIIIFSSLLFLFEMGVFYEYQMFLTNRTFSVLLQTNSEETKEFLQEIFSVKFIFSIFGLMITMGIIPYILYYLFFYMIMNEKFLFIVRTIIVFSFLYFMQGNFPKKFSRYYSYLSIIRIGREWLIAMKRERENEMALGKINQVKTELIEKKEIVNTVVLVIGESASRNYMRVYGYSLDTTPFFAEEEKLGNLIAFSDVISPDSLTNLVVPSIMTTKNYEEEKEWYSCQNMITIFKKAGYRTYWISNQPKNENIGRVFSNLADVSFFGEEKRIDDEGYDDILLKEGLPLIGKEEKRFVVFHLIGSHNSYVKRYPKSHTFFYKEDIYKIKDEKIKQYIAEYCNSIRYTDFILKQIIEYFKKENTLLFYLSDHAEEMYESRNLRGHSGENGSRYMVEIPMAVYSSKEFQRKNKILWESMLEKKDNPYMSDDIIHSIMFSSGVISDAYQEERNIFSNNFVSSRKRMYLGKDYDTFWKYQFTK